METSFSSRETMRSDEEPEFGNFEDKGDLFAEFMPRLSEAPAVKSTNEPPPSKLQPSMFDDRDDMLAEFMFPKEGASSAKSENELLDLEIQASQFQGMDDLLAEFMPQQEEAPPPEARIVPFSPKPAAVVAGESAVPAAQPMPPEENALPAELESVPNNPSPEPIKDESVRFGESPREHESAGIEPEAKSVAAITPLEEKALPSKKSDAARKPGSEPVKLESPHPDGRILKLDASARKAETKTSVAIKPPEEKAAAAKVVPIKSPLKSAQPSFSVPVAHKSKMLLVAAACICLLAAVAVPTYFLSGSSSQSPKPTDSQAAVAAPSPAAAAAAENGQMPAVPVSQIIPKYPQSAIKKRASGALVLDLGINSDGEVVKATPVSGPEVFHDEVISTVMKWRYKPASMAGSNIPSQSRVTFNFHLK